MKLTLPTLLVASLASTALAAPVDTMSTSAASKKFFLVVQSDDARVNSQCVTAYHVGAGQSTNQIQQCGPAPEKSYTYAKATGKLNYLGYGNADANGGSKSALRADPGLPYSSWGDVHMDAGDAGTEFTYSKEAGGFLQKFGSTGASPADGLGFIACRWSHNGGWQLFALGDKNAPILGSCAKVKLLRGCYNTDQGCVGGTF